MASAEFRLGKRSKANALRSGMVILDVDDGATVEDARSIITGTEIACAIYTTASHRSEHHKFRICVPISDVVSPTEYTNAWYGLNAVFDGIADQSKRGCESLFYLPGLYLSTSSNWHHARFRFRCSVASRAAKMGYDIDSNYLVSVFNELDSMDEAHHQTQHYQRQLVGDAQSQDGCPAASRLAVEPVPSICVMPLLSFPQASCLNVIPDA